MFPPLADPLKHARRRRRPLRQTSGSLVIAALAIAMSLGAVRGSAQAPAVETLESVVERSRMAINAAAIAAHAGTWVLRGESVENGVKGKTELAFTAKGWFAARTDSKLGGRDGWDGHQAWTIDWIGMPRRVAYEELERRHLLTLLTTGLWLNSIDRLDLVLNPALQESTHIVLTLRLKGSSVDNQVWIDRSSRRIARVIRPEGDNDQVIEFGEYRRHLEVWWPARLKVTSRGMVDTATLRKVSREPLEDRRFRRPAALPSDTEFDDSKPAALEVRKAPSGHLLVHPVINGQDAGWFIFDSGAGSMVIDPRAADRLGMPKLGQVAVVGFGGTVKGSFRKGRDFVLGPLALRNSIYVETDLSFLEAFFKVPVGGICGYDLFARAIAVVDVKTPAVSLHSPGGYQLPPGNSWQPLELDDRIPVVAARFEGGHEGLFRIDTGANDNLTFFPGATERLGLLKNRETSKSSMGGVGGIVEGANGVIEWFELGGRRFDALKVQFALSAKGAARSPHITGNLGVGVLGSLVLIFDYRNERIAFQKRP